jgi:hypothetical protein
LYARFAILAHKLIYPDLFHSFRVLSTIPLIASRSWYS